MSAPGRSCSECLRRRDAIRREARALRRRQDRGQRLKPEVLEAEKRALQWHLEHDHDQAPPAQVDAPPRGPRRASSERWRQPYLAWQGHLRASSDAQGPRYVVMDESPEAFQAWRHGPGIRGHSCVCPECCAARRRRD